MRGTSVWIMGLKRVNQSTEAPQTGMVSLYGFKMIVYLKFLGRCSRCCADFQSNVAVVPIQNLSSTSHSDDIDDPAGVVLQ